VTFYEQRTTQIYLLKRNYFATHIVRGGAVDIIVRPLKKLVFRENLVKFGVGNREFVFGFKVMWRRHCLIFVTYF
jgi:hypothetical protein